MSASKMNESAENINPVVDMHPDGTALVRVDGAELNFASVADRPRVRDLDFAGWLGYADPRMIRKIIKSMIATKKLNVSELMYAAERQTEGRPAREFWLTREEALLVATQSGTPRAWKITRAMVRVFDAVMERRPLPTAPSIDPAVSAALALVPGLVAQLEAYRADLGAMRAEIGTLRGELATGVIGAEVAKAEVLRPLARVAALYATPVRKVKAARRSLENRLRAILGFVGPGSAWSMLPRRLLDVAQRQLTMWLDEAIAARAVALRSSQTDLFAKN